METQIPYIHISSMNKSNILYYSKNPEFIVGDNYIYLDLSKIDSIGFERILRSYQRQNIIIDLRNYPNWVLHQIADLFADKEITFAKYSNPDLSIPGSFDVYKALTLLPKRNCAKVKYNRIAVLVDYTTISRGEFLCMAFQSLPNVCTFGGMTTGADGNVSRVTLPGGINTQFTGLEILYPNGDQTQNKGIKIDFPFQIKGTGIATGEDEALSYLINSLN